jgi:hypothetical protein
VTDPLQPTPVTDKVPPGIADSGAEIVGSGGAADALVTVSNGQANNQPATRSTAVRPDHRKHVT